MPEVKTIPITFDKSHLITIGERLYAQSLELIRELIANAYDADATHVWIELTPYTLTVKDNGSGMDEAGLRQYFNIGSQEKKHNKTSPMFHRTRIGEFGIGKFAVLAACDVFVTHTQKGSFAAKLTFDKNLWSGIDEWELPIHILSPSSAHGNGTTVTLERLKKQLSLPEIERFIKERVPLKAQDFQVYLNGKHMVPTLIHGKKFPIRFETSFGMVHGEIVVPNVPPSDKEETRGIECFVKSVFVKRETFDFEYSHSFGLNRLKGEIHADFLPITSDRSRFITDTAEYQEFYRFMRLEIQNVMKKLKDNVTVKEDQKADGILRDALSHIRKALKKNPEFAPTTHVTTAASLKSRHAEVTKTFAKEEGMPELREADVLEDTRDDAAEGTSLADIPQEKRPVDRSSKKVRVKTLGGKEVVARRMQIGNFSVVCRAEPLGEDAPPVTWESGIIFINRDHPLYRRFSRHAEVLTLFVTELIAQEIAALRAGSVKDAFALQNQILTDAWA